MSETKKITITLERKQDRINFVLKVPSEIEEYYKSISGGETQQSTMWLKDVVDSNSVVVSEGVSFYKLTEKTERIAQSLSTFYPCFDDFGAELLNGDRINLAPLRTVGASEGVVMYSNRFDNVNMIDFEMYIKKLGSLTKMLWLDYIGDKQVKAVISFEL